MGRKGDGWKSVLLNAALTLCGVIVLALLYAFVAGTLLPAPASSPEQPPATSPPTDDVIIQVAVRNGAGVPGLAGQTTRFLRRHGFDVVEAGNYTSFDQQHSVVVDRIGNAKAARRVAAVLGIPLERVSQEIRRDYYLDASVIIGKDYASLNPFKKD